METHNTEINVGLSTFELELGRVGLVGCIILFLHERMQDEDLSMCLVECMKN